MKLRKILPNFGYINGIKINIPTLFDELKFAELSNFSWSAASMYGDSDENLFIRANAACKKNFNGNDDENYQEINLSKPRYSKNKLNDDDILREKSIFYRTKRLNKDSSAYSEHADETLHSLDESYYRGEFKKILDFFQGKVCRVRLARMMPKSNINLHIDYDPSYIFRYHLPLITEEQCVFIAEKHDKKYYFHMPADGRIFWLNTGVKHGVNHYGNHIRIHLLIDVSGDNEKNNIPNITFFDGYENTK